MAKKSLTYKQFWDRLVREGLMLERSTAFDDVVVVTRAAMGLGTPLYSFVYRGDETEVPPIEIKKVADVMGVEPSFLYQTDAERARPVM